MSNSDERVDLHRQVFAVAGVVAMHRLLAEWHWESVGGDFESIDADCDAALEVAVAASRSWNAAQANVAGAWDEYRRHVADLEQRSVGIGQRVAAFGAESVGGES